MPRVLVLPELMRRRGDHIKLLEAAGLEIYVPDETTKLMDPAVLAKELQGISATLAGSEPYIPDVLDEAKDLRVIARVGVGYDAVDVPAATERNIAVTVTPGTNEHSVAETAIAFITGIYRGFPFRDQKVRSGNWERWSLPRLSGRTLGLVGLGRIGKAMVPRAQGLGLSVIASDPYADQDFARENNVRLCELDELLTEADIVSLHAPATPENVDLINQTSLGKMKQGSVLVNTARGNLVDEDALADALSSGHLMGAGLDVFKEEPLPADSPLLKFDNVLTAPHCGGIDHESEYAMCTMAAQCVVTMYQGDWPEGAVVNAEIREKFKW